MRGPIAAGLLALSSVAHAQLSTTCQNGVCYSLNVPDATASSGSGDIFFQLSAPTSMEWVALAQGKQMSGANMFIMYTSSNGTGVTVSPRTTSGHNTPHTNSDTKLTILSGSGVSNGKMIANVQCSSCSGNADFKTGTGDWVFAYKSGSAINSDSTDADIKQHDNQGTISFDYSKAKGGSSANPLTSSSSSSGSSSGSKCSGSAQSAGASATSGGSSSQTSGGAPPWATMWGGSRPSGAPSGYGGYGKRQSSSDDSCDDTAASNTNGLSSSNEGLSPSRETTLLLAHGVMASLAFVILFPLGAIIVRLLSFPGLVWVHAGIQVLAYLIFIAAFGIGVYVADKKNEIGEYHPVIGIVLFVLIFFQPILGTLHHNAFAKEQRRTFWTYGHIWLGRTIITLGIINGGLGLLLADNSSAGNIAYGVVAGVVWLAYVVAIVIGERRRSRAAPATAHEQPPKYSEVAPNEASESSRDGPPVEYYGNRHPVAE